MIKIGKFTIDDETYLLDKNKYYLKIFDKKQIVIGHTFGDNMNHYIGWKNRYNGKYKKNAAFTIDTDGSIYQHFDPKYYSNFLNIQDVDKYIIGIVLVNKGWLMRNIQTNEFFDFLSRPVKGDNVVNKRWRNHSYWAPYSNKQIESLIELCGYLSEKFGIKLQTLGHNTMINDIFEYEGVVFRSNYMKEFTDLSPAFDFIDFKNKLEKNINYYEKESN